MINRWKSKKSKIIIILVVVLIIMSGVGILMNFKLRDLLQRYTENQVTEQARALAQHSSEQFRLEMNSLESVAKNISSDAEMDSKILDTVIGDKENVSMGILRLDGTALVGETLNFADFSGVKKAFHGHSAVCYKEGQGVLFTTPVLDGENVIYVLYKLYDESILLSKFGLS